jgi:hypothetical protein
MMQDTWKGDWLRKALVGRYGVMTHGAESVDGCFCFREVRR